MAPRSFRPRPVLAVVTALGMLALSACGVLGGGDGGTGVTDDAASRYQTVVIAMPDWTGGQATAAMAAHLLQQDLGISVALRRTSQEAAWDALGTGEVHAIMEDWGALPEKTGLYVERKRNVIDAGELGITGRVGWYVTREFADAHPGALRAGNLDDYAEELGGKLLQGDPYYATHDKAVIEDLDLPYRPAATGSESALIEEITAADRDGTPVLAYFWRPHWLHTEVDLAEVELPAGSYPHVRLRKYLNAYFAGTGGEAAALLRGFSWTEEEQNEVAGLIADGLTPRTAAARWAGAHPDRVREWLEPG